MCGSTKHLKRDCPELAEQKQKQLERSECYPLQCLYTCSHFGPEATVFYPKMMELWVPPCLDPIIGPYDGGTCSKICISIVKWWSLQCARVRNP